ncbi:HD domain-containing protein [Bacillus proteolyticus]|uniref:HD domain-containing protein n=1 Tax=Bacillus proteolyticus TaxID=2026192 RepID=UPI0030F3FC63
MTTLIEKEQKRIGPLMEKVLNYRNIHSAYLRTKNNYMNKELHNCYEIEMFEKSIPYVYEDIKLILNGEKDYVFHPLEVLNKPKKREENCWSTRPIVRIQFFDAVIIQCIINILTEEIRYILPKSNYGYKLNHPTAESMYQYWKHGYSKFVNKEIECAENKRYRYLVEADIQNFYPSINKEWLIDDIQAVLSLNEGDVDFICWLKKLLNLECVTENGEIKELDGLPQGPLYSPLFALFYVRKYLDNIKDKFSNVTAFSYVDDIRVYCETEDEAQAVIEELSVFMSKKGLQLNEEKSGTYKVDSEKKLETKIMGKASNLDRAIRDEIILTSQDKKEMRERLSLLMKELKELYKLDENKQEKIEERLGKFANYRIVKLLDEESAQWRENLSEFVNFESLNSNFIAMWHALYLSAVTIQEKTAFIQALELLLDEGDFEEISYVKYSIYSYMLRWSPKELRYSNEKIKNTLDSCIINNSPIMIKAILTNLHPDWLEYLQDYKEILSVSSDTEIQNLMFALGLDTEKDYTYYSISHEDRLYMEGTTVTHTSTTFNLEENFLGAEEFKNIKYRLFNNDNGEWSCEINNTERTLNEETLSHSEVKDVLTSLALWLDFQFNFSNERIPCSVVDPDYIFYDKRSKDIYLYGNPAYKNDIYYYEHSNKLWKEAFTNLLQRLFKLNLETGMNIFTENNIIKIWQYRILRKLFHKGFNIRSFIKFMLTVLRREEDNISISHEQVSLDRVLSHYIKDFESLDNLLLISQFVESSWKNGSKECNFYTLHNHEHARYLIQNIHQMFKKADFSIYINSKEAFRLFSACYLHDVGMLSAPEEKRLNDMGERDINDLLSNVENIMWNLNAIEEDEEEKGLQLPYIYDIHSEVEKVREGIVRGEHPGISERELVSDYPQLPLTVAERRDIGIISTAHGESKSDVNKINETLHDGYHPIRLKLLSLLLRLADLSDVSKERVRKEILERNHKRMSDVSIFHWIKHLSVDSLQIKNIRRTVGQPIIVQLLIIHNYLPTGIFEKEKLEKRCGSNCKFKLEDNGLLDGFYKEGKKNIIESDSDFKYFDDNTCNLTCAFVNESYNWFFAEIIYINMYLKQKNINVRFNLNIKLNERANKDFYYVNNRNDKFTAQEFMHDFFQ